MNCVPSCVASCFHCCPEGFWTELQHQLWVLCAAESGHSVHLTSDLPTASGREAFLLRKGRPSSRSYMVLSKSHSKGCFSHHVPNTSLCSFLEKIQGSGRSHEWGPAQYSWNRPDLQQMSQLGHSPQVRGNMERAWIWEKGLVSLVWHRNIWCWFH